MARPTFENQARASRLSVARDRDDVGQLDAGGVVRVGVVVAGAVPGRGDDEHPGRVGGGDRVADGLRVLGVAPGVVRDGGAVGGRVEQRLDGVGGRARPVGAHHPQRHDPRARRDAGDAEPVAGRPPRPCPRRASRARGRPAGSRPPARSPSRRRRRHSRCRRRRARCRRPRPGSARRSRRGRGGERATPVSMTATVDASTRCDVPGLGRVDVGVGRPGQTADGLARVVEAPELAEAGVVGERVEETRRFGST